MKPITERVSKKPVPPVTITPPPPKGRSAIPTSPLGTSLGRGFERSKPTTTITRPTIGTGIPGFPTSSPSRNAAGEDVSTKRAPGTSVPQLNGLVGRPGSVDKKDALVPLTTIPDRWVDNERRQSATKKVLANLPANMIGGQVLSMYATKPVDEKAKFRPDKYGVGATLPPTLTQRPTEPIVPPVADEEILKPVSDTGANRPNVISEALASAAGASPTPVPEPVKSGAFPIFTIPVWTREGGFLFGAGNSEPGVADLLQNLDLVTGQYVITMRMPQPVESDNVDISTPFTFDVLGKKMILHRALLEPRKGICRLWVEVVENIIPFLILATAALAATGFAGWGLGNMFEKVDRVIISTGNLVKVIALFGGLGLLAWYGLPKLFKRKPIGG